MSKIRPLCAKKQHRYRKALANMVGQCHGASREADCLDLLAGGAPFGGGGNSLNVVPLAFKRFI
jgi:hypothetical protein